MGLPNVRYLTGFTGSNGALLLTPGKAIFYTDPRYQFQAAEETDCVVKIARGPLVPEIVKQLQRMRLTRLGFERERLSFESYDVLRRETAGKLKLTPVPALVERLRMVKSEIEIRTIETSVKLNSEALSQALKHFRSGMTEADLAAEIEYRMRQLGADGPAFETIVATGERTALPHAHPTSRFIQNNQLLLIDMGAIVAGYCSDMTRTFAVGQIAAKTKRIYQAVLESQLAALDAVKAGTTTGAVDRAARRVLEKYGFDKAFIHSTGHGLGLEIHELPRVGRLDQTPLEAGMAITIEPGAYFEGFGGVRIEDTVIVTENGCRILTPTKKDLVSL